MGLTVGSVGNTEASTTRTSNLNVPCWSETNDYKTWEQQNSPAFFAKYASSPANNGPYYIDGVKQSFGEFMGS